MRRITWILGLGLVLFMACGVELSPTHAPEAAMQSTAALTSSGEDSDPAAEPAAAPGGLLDCFSECVANCTQPPDKQCAIDCSCLCGLGRKGCR